jgi:hypothetical protein
LRRTSIGRLTDSTEAGCSSCPQRRPP